MREQARSPRLRLFSFPVRPPGGGLLDFQNRFWSLLQKPVQKRFLPQKGGSLSVEGVFAKKFRTANSIQNGSSRLLISQRFLPRSVPNRHLRDTLGSKGFFRTSVPTVSPLSLADARCGVNPTRWVSAPRARACRRRYLSPLAALASSRPFSKCSVARLGRRSIVKPRVYAFGTRFYGIFTRRARTLRAEADFLSIHTNMEGLP
jgi:hypothetical protein